MPITLLHNGGGIEIIELAGLLIHACNPYRIVCSHKVMWFHISRLVYALSNT